MAANDGMIKEYWEN